MNSTSSMNIYHMSSLAYFWLHLHIHEIICIIMHVGKIIIQKKVNESPGSPGEMLSKKCVVLLKMALRPDFWANTELKLAWFDKLLTTVENHQPNFNNICTALELLSFLLTILVSGLLDFKDFVIFCSIFMLIFNVFSDRCDINCSQLIFFKTHSCWFCLKFHCLYFSCHGIGKMDSTLIFLLIYFF